MILAVYRQPSGAALVRVLEDHEKDHEMWGHKPLYAINQKFSDPESQEIADSLLRLLKRNYADTNAVGGVACAILTSLAESSINFGAKLQRQNHDRALQDAHALAG